MMIAGNEIYLAKSRVHMRRLAAETGGGYFVVSKAEPIEEIYRRIEEELRHQYSLGYVSDQPAGGNRYRKIRLSTTRKNLIVRTREGYYPA
jgi:VWFA-related protein